MFVSWITNLLGQNHMCCTFVNLTPHVYGWVHMSRIFFHEIRCFCWQTPIFCWMNSAFTLRLLALVRISPPKGCRRWRWGFSIERWWGFAKQNGLLLKSEGLRVENEEMIFTTDTELSTMSNNIQSCIKYDMQQEWEMNRQAWVCDQRIWWGK